MAVKFGRNYLLSIISPSQTIEIRPPFTLELDVIRGDFGGSGHATFRIYNLSKLKRDELRRDSYAAIGSNFLNQIRIKLDAGYGDSLSTIFTGQIQQAFSVREGVDFITQITAFDGLSAFSNARANVSARSGTDQRAVISQLITTLKEFGVDEGSIGDFSGVLSRANCYSGSTISLLHELTGGSFFIDNGKANVLLDNECIESARFVVTPASGLLNTPVRESRFVTFDILFEPKLAVGTQVFIESFTDNSFNSEYIVKNLTHKGVISDAVSGGLITSVGAIAGKYSPVAPRSN